MDQDITRRIDPPNARLILDWTGAQTVTVSTVSALQTALANASASGTPTSILVDANLTLGALQNLTVSGSARIQLTSTGDHRTLSGGGETALRTTPLIQVTSSSAELYLKDITISRSYGQAASGGGGVSTLGLLYLDVDAIIEHNRATRNGGGVCVLGSGGKLVMDGGIIRNNTAGDNGGGVFSPTDIELLSGEITDNKTNTGDGGGVFLGPIQQFPIGYIWVTVDCTNPGSTLGYGVWERFAQGRALVGVDPNDTTFYKELLTGGTKTHTLTIAEMPSHVHQYKGFWFRTSDSGSKSNRSRKIKPLDPIDTNSSMLAVGGGQAHNNMQPYEALCIWRRVA